MAKNLQTKFSTRQYMLSRDFEIYYYNEPASEKVSIHSHDYYEFYFFLEGDVSIWIEGEQYPLKYGDMVLIPPGSSTWRWCMEMRSLTGDLYSGSVWNIATS